MATTEQALSFNICTFSREYKEWKMVSTNISVKRNRILQQWSGNQSFQRIFISEEKEQARLLFLFFKTRKFEFKLHLFPHLIEGIQLIWQTETCIKSQHCVSNGYTWLRTSRECGNISYEELKRIFFSFLKSIQINLKQVVIYLL